MRDPSRRALALRGMLVVAVGVAAVVAAAGFSTSSADGQPVITTVLPASAGLVQPDTPVQYRGATVGTLDAIAASPSGSRLTLRINPADISSIPAGVQTRLLPLTLFGDQYIALVPVNGTGGHIHSGEALDADMSAGTVNLYQTYTKFTRLLSAVDPAQLDMALTAMADALRGRGAELGRVIDQLHTATSQLDPQMARLAAQLPTVADMTRQLAESTPDLLGVMRNTVAESQTVLVEQQNIAALLGVGTQLEGQGQTLLDSEGGRAVQMLYETAPLSSALAANPAGPATLLSSIQDFLNGANQVFSAGRFNFVARLSLSDPYPYTSADCPRYYGESGLDCGGSGASASTSSLGSLLSGPALSGEKAANP